MAVGNNIYLFTTMQFDLYIFSFRAFADAGQMKQRSHQIGGVNLALLILGVILPFFSLVMDRHFLLFNKSCAWSFEF